MKLVNLSKNRGFTLIELLVVMAILGLLATVGLVSFRTAQMKGRDARRKHDLEQIQKALEMYYNDKGRYPDPAIIPGPGEEWRDATVTNGALYMKEMPTDPRGIDYCYWADAAGSGYRLYAQLENPKDPNCLDGDCSTARSCGTGTYNYGVASSNETP